MTSIVAWAGVDQRAPSSLYIASDSRISWGNSYAWDQGRKTFASAKTAHIFGYWGDVLFPSMALPSVVDRIEHGAIPSSLHSPFSGVGKAIRELWLGYPLPERRDFGVILGSRTGEFMRSTFHLAVLTYAASDDTWRMTDVSMPAVSASLHVAGSGAHEVRRAQCLWDESAHKNTSRAMFSAFCESLAKRKDPSSGGGPQLVGLHRKGPAKTFGVVAAGQRFLNGARVGRETAGTADVDWFNEFLERVDGARMKRLPKAAKHERR